MFKYQVIFYNFLMNKVRQNFDWKNRFMCPIKTKMNNALLYYSIIFRENDKKNCRIKMQSFKIINLKYCNVSQHFFFGSLHTKLALLWRYEHKFYFSYKSVIKCINFNRAHGYIKVLLNLRFFLTLKNNSISTLKGHIILTV